MEHWISGLLGRQNFLLSLLQKLWKFCEGKISGYELFKYVFLYEVSILANSLHAAVIEFATII